MGAEPSFAVSASAASETVSSDDVTSDGRLSTAPESEDKLRVISPPAVATEYASRLSGIFISPMYRS